MSSRMKRLALGVLTGLLTAGLVAVGGVATASAEGLSSHETAALSAVVATDGLSEEEAEGLLFMREEEKLAHDVYLTLYERWELPVFQNVASSEQRHMDALKTLIDRYGLDDPVAGNDIGEFSDSTLQSLYGELIRSGQASPAAALRVAAKIEEIDILDLEEQIDLTDEADILRVYENLIRGSRNHLRAFVSTLDAQEGESYGPQYLEQETYDEILSGSVERGGRGAGRRWQRTDGGSGLQGLGAGACVQQQDGGQGAWGGSGRWGRN